jgi:predicted HicB family RNase H-like nuclease
MTLILNVPENREATLKAKAQAQGVPVEQYVERVLDQDLDEPATTSATASPRHISE